MKPLLTLALFAVLACASAYAADTTTSATAPAAKNSQQDKMTACNAKAGDMKGDERKAFMKTCLSATPAPAPAQPQNKMAECNAKTKGMTKADADKARSECMKG
jgi:hypothetical protein